MVYNSKKKQQQPSGVALTDFQKGEIAALYEHTALNNKQIAVKLKVSEHCVGRLIAKFRGSPAPTPRTPARPSWCILWRACPPRSSCPSCS